MGHQNEIEFVVANLLARSFTLVGLAALWAATSNRHWFLRTALFFALLAPLLIIPAYEPMVAFAIQGAVVVLGIQAYRRWQTRRSRPAVELSENATLLGGVRFSLSTLLLLMVIVAAVIPVALKLPQLNGVAWTSVVVAGASCGLATLIAALMFSFTRKLVVWPLGLLLCVAAGFALTRFDWLAYAIVKQSGWPPTDTNPVLTGLIGADEEVLTWLMAIPAICILLVSILLLFSVGRGRLRTFARVATVALVAWVAAFPVSILWKLAHPLPLPHVQLPNPNGYDDFVASGNAFNGSGILNTNVAPTSTAQLASEVAKYASGFERVRLGLSRPSQAPVWPTNLKALAGYPYLTEIQSMRSVARALDLEARLAREEGRFSDVSRISIENMRVGQASTRGGLIVNYLVAVAVEGIGQESLYPAIGNLDAAACRETIASLEQVDQDREPLDAVFHDDRIYSENAWGWYGHLFVLLEDAAYPPNDFQPSIVHAARRVETINRLLRTEIALRLYRLEQRSFPDRLEKLVPQYMSALPVDPFDVDHGPMRYSPKDGGYLLYSVGYDRDDDGGRPSPRESGWLDDGDMRLDSIYALEPDVANSPDKNEAAANEGEPTDPTDAEQ